MIKIACDNLIDTAWRIEASLRKKKAKSRHLVIPRDRENPAKPDNEIEIETPIEVANGFSITGKQMLHFIVLNFITGKDIADVVNESSRMDFLNDIASGLFRSHAELHHRNVVHCDLKLDDLMWDHAALRIINFGLSRLTGEPNSGGAVPYIPSRSGEARLLIGHATCIQWELSFSTSGWTETQFSTQRGHSERTGTMFRTKTN
jgi:serine/threonine protein kinase